PAARPGWSSRSTCPAITFSWTTPSTGPPAKAPSPCSTSRVLKIRRFSRRCNDGGAAWFPEKGGRLRLHGPGAGGRRRRRLQPGGGEAAAVSIQIAGVACGSHLALAPAYIEAKPGSMLRIANEGLWPHEIYLSTEDRPVLMSDPESRRRVLASVRLEPGDPGA